MAYSDYGGYAFKNGVRIEERSDCVIPENGSGEELEMGHVVLGTGPVYTLLYKQSGASFYHKTEFLCSNDTSRYWKKFDEPDCDEGLISESFNIEGCEISVHLAHTDNYYIYVEHKEPDGTLWHGFSGYGVGEGLEDSADHPYDTNECVKQLSELFEVSLTS